MSNPFVSADASATIKVTPSQLSELLKFTIKEREPVMVWGSPGIGKSETIDKALRDAGEFERVETFFALLHDPTVFQGFGIPNREDGVMDFLKARLMTGTGPVAFFMDELPNAPTLVKNAGLDVVLNPDRHLPRGSYVVAAGNRPTDKTGASAFPAALNRRFLHVEMVADLEDWCRHEMATIRFDGLSAEQRSAAVLHIAYARYAPDCITGTPDLTQRAYANPASMSKIGRLMKAGIPASVEQQTLCGTIGDTHGMQLQGFAQTWRSMPSLDHILNDPKQADLPPTTASMFTTIHGLALRGATDRHFGSVVEYALRLPREFGQTLVNDTVAVGKLQKVDLQNCADYVRWSVATQ